MKRLLAALSLVLAGCGAMTHPRYAPELERRWTDCQRIVVIPGTIHVAVKNYKTEDYFQDDEVGKRFGELFAQAAARVLRDEGDREPRIAAEAAAAFGGDMTLARSAADKMLEHAREWMARDPGYADEKLAGLPADTSVVPVELRRGFDAILVVGGRTKFESVQERNVRLFDIAVRNAIAYPLIMLSPLIPPLLPVSYSVLTRGLSGYWVGAPNESYFSVALFDAQSGRLLYTNDWYDTSKVVDEDDFESVARKSLRSLVRVKGSDTAPLGEPPEGWDPSP